MNWIEEAKRLFDIEKPEHFTDHKHCDECAEHDAMLLNSEPDGIGLEELGNPGWDPVCFCTAEGMKYFMPAFVRLSLESVSSEFYFAQFLFHLEYDGRNNKLIKSCNKEQRQFIVAFLEHMIENHAPEIEIHSCSDDALRVYQLWSEQ